MHTTPTLTTPATRTRRSARVALFGATAWAGDTAHQAGSAGQSPAATIAAPPPPPVYRCFEAWPTLPTGANGTVKADVINGTNGPNSIRGFRGDDRICGLRGNGFIHGNEGNDRLCGDQGNDTVYGDQGNDRLYGREGNAAAVLDQRRIPTMVPAVQHAAWLVSGHVARLRRTAQ